MKHQNWAGNQHFESRPILYPNTIEQIQQTVLQAADHKQTIRAVGSLHSFSELIPGANILLSLEKLQNTGFQLSKTDHVRCPAGKTLAELYAFLSQHQHCFPVMGDATPQTIAGAISTGTHGPSIHHGSLSSFITALTLMDGTGKLRTLTGPDLDPARISLGLLGIIIEVEFKVVPQIYIEWTVKPELDWLDNYRQDLENSYFQTEWYSHLPNRPATIKRGSICRAPCEFSITNTRRRDGYFLQIANTLYTLSHQKILPASMTNGLLQKTFARPQTLRGPIEQVLVANPNRRLLSSEFSLPKSQALTAIQHLNTLTWPEPLWFCTRPIKAESAWLSMAYQQDSVALSGISFWPPKYIPKSTALFNQIMTELGARPHWPKACQHENIDLFSAFPKLADFLKIRQQYDPDSVFLTNTMKRWLSL